MATINPLALSAMQLGLKYNYAPIAKDLIAADYPFYGMMQDTQDFEEDFGGRSMIWELLTDRMHNVGARDEVGFMPGFSASTNDDIDRPNPIEASLGRAYCYAAAAFSTQQMAKTHKKFEQQKGWTFPKWIQAVQDDFGMFLERQILGDKTGMLGTVVSVAFGGGVTTVTLQPASTINTRGIAGTQRLWKNQKVSIIRAADWATSPRLAKIDTNVGASGTPMQKIVSVSDIHDMSAAPTIGLSGNLTGAPALAAGDIIVEGMSRTSANNGGQEAAEALNLMDGIFSFVDNGTLTTSLYNNLRATTPQLNSQCNLSAGGRPPTWQIFQVLMDRLNRRRGNASGPGRKIEQDYVIFTERSVKTAYVAAPGEGQKEYIQEGKAKKMVGGFSDVTLAFLGNDTLVPWVAYDSIPYGHALVIRPNLLKMMWDIKPGPIDEDGLILRKVTGKPLYTYEMQGFGNCRMEEPWNDGRVSGLNGIFT